MPLREAKSWHVYRYQNPGSNFDGKHVLALLINTREIQGVLINSNYARSEHLKRVEARVRFDFLPRPNTSLRFDHLFRGQFEEFTQSEKEKKWVVTGRARYQVLTKALSSESYLLGEAKDRLWKENLAFLNHWARRERN